MMPLSGGGGGTPTVSSSSRPTTPTKHLPPPGTSHSAKSIMDNDNKNDNNDDDSSLESANLLGATSAGTHSNNSNNNRTTMAVELGNLVVQQQHLTNGGLLSGMGCGMTNGGAAKQQQQQQQQHASISRPTTPTNSIGRGSSYSCGGNSGNNSNHGRGTGSHLSMFPRTSPRTPTKSQPDPARTNPPYDMKGSTGAATGSKSPRPTTTTKLRPKSPSVPGWKKKTSEMEQHFSSASEAGAPTEVMTNVTSMTNDLVLTHRIPRKSKQKQHTDPSEAGAPTEVMTNRTSDVLTRVRQTWNANTRNGDSGKGSPIAAGPDSQRYQYAGPGNEIVDSRGVVGTEELQPLYKIPQQHAATTTTTATTNSRASSRISSYWNGRKGNNRNHQYMPSLVDSQSSSVSSLPDERLPDLLAGEKYASHSAHARLLDNVGPAANPSRLSNHVQKARQQSILSPSASETTVSMPSIAAAVVNEPSVKQEDRRMTRQSQNEVIVEEEEEESKSQYAGTASGREDDNRRGTPSGNGRAAALAAQIRRTKWTVRGAQQQYDEQNQQSAISESVRKKASATPDPIISIAGGPDDYNGYHDEGEDEESTLPEYSDKHQRGVRDRADDFVVYNERSVRNAADVFQSRGPLDSPESEYSHGKEEDKNRRRSYSQHSKYSNASTERGKSPIQPLFSLDRVDLEPSEPHTQRMRGRSMTPEQFMRANVNIAEEVNSRRSHSLSRSLERNLSNQGPNSPPGVNVPEYLFVHKQKYDDEDNSVLDEELVLIMEGKGEYIQNGTSTRSSPNTSRRSGTPSSIRAKTPSESKRSTSDRTQNSAAAARPGSATETSITSNHVLNGVLTTKSVRDKIREFNRRTPDKWRNAPAAKTTSPFSPSQRGLPSRASRPASYTYNDKEEEKKEEDVISGLNLSAIEVEDDSSVKSLRDKLEKRFSQRHASLGLGREDGDTNDDNYSVESLRGKLEQRINDAQKVPNNVDDDDGSVRSLRERFETPQSKNMGEHVSNLRAMFESKQSGRQSIPVKSMKLADLYGSLKVSCESMPEMIPLSNPSSNRQTRNEYLGEQLPDRAEFDKQHVNTKTFPDDAGPITQAIDSNEWYHGIPGVDSEPEQRVTKVPELEAEKEQSGNRGTSRTSVLSRFNQWADDQQAKIQSPHQVQDDLLEGSKQASAMEDFESNGNSFGGMSPNTEDLIAAVSDDERRLIPGSHWTTRGDQNGQGKMLQRGDINGASSESDYSEAVTLDASIAEVSLLTNPSPIRSKCSKDSREVDRNSDASSSVFELLAKKSEASSSQPSEAAAPLISGPLHRMSDEYSHESLNMNVSPVSSKRPNPQASYQNVDKHDSIHHTNTAIAVADSAELAHEWIEDSFPSQKEPPDDPFHTDPADLSTFSDSDWPDFGDKRDFARAGRMQTGKSSWSIDPPQIPSLQIEDNANASKLNQKKSRRLDPPSAFEPSDPSFGMTSLPAENLLPVQQRFHIHENHPHTTSNQSAIISPNRPAKEPAAKRYSELSPKEVEDTLCDRHSQKVQTDLLVHDYGPSRDQVYRLKSASREPSIQVPEVPPLPSPFDPNYASIMESRHKMLLSRQRALLHRRAAREKVHSFAQPGFFGRTHPDRTLKKPVLPEIDSSNSSSRLPVNNTFSASNDFAITDEPWETFGPRDPTLRTFEALTRPRHRQNEIATPLHQRASPGSSSKAPSPSPRVLDTGTSNQSRDSTLISKVKSTFGLNNGYKEASQSEEVIARITAVRATRMRRYHEKNIAHLSYRQRMIDREAWQLSPDGQRMNSTQHQDDMSGYRFYAHDEDGFGPPQAQTTYTFRNSHHDDTSLSTNSNAIEYAANLAMD